MTSRTGLGIVAAGLIALVAAPVILHAQNRSDTQMLVELRLVQEQLQKTQLAINQLAERVKTAESRLDAQASDTRKGFADQKVLIDNMASGLQSLVQRENESSIRVGQLSQEMKSILSGLNQQQTALNDIIKLLEPLAAAGFASAAATAATDPAGGGGSGPKPVPTNVSPLEYYNTAFGYYYAGQFDLAVQALEAAIKRFPDHPLAAKAQLTIGESYFQMGKHFQEALAAYTTVITNYKDPEVLPEAYYKQGLTYEQIGQVEAAIKSLQQVISLYKDSPTASLATQALRRIKK